MRTFYRVYDLVGNPVATTVPVGNFVTKKEAEKAAKPFGYYVDEHAIYDTAIDFFKHNPLQTETLPEHERRAIAAAVGAEESEGVVPHGGSVSTVYMAYSTQGQPLSVPIPQGYFASKQVAVLVARAMRWSILEIDVSDSVAEYVAKNPHLDNDELRKIVQQQFTMPGTVTSRHLLPWTTTDCDQCGGTFLATRTSSRARKEVELCPECESYNQGHTDGEKSATDKREVTLFAGGSREVTLTIDQLRPQLPDLWASISKLRLGLPLETQEIERINDAWHIMGALWKHIAGDEHQVLTLQDIPSDKLIRKP